jgi:hypothetical protein
MHERRPSHRHRPHGKHSTLNPRTWVPRGVPPLIVPPGTSRRRRWARALQAHAERRPCLGHWPHGKHPTLNPCPRCVPRLRVPTPTSRCRRWRNALRWRVSALSWASSPMQAADAQQGDPGLLVPRLVPCPTRRRRMTEVRRLAISKPPFRGPAPSRASCLRQAPVALHGDPSRQVSRSALLVRLPLDAPG